MKDNNRRLVWAGAIALGIWLGCLVIPYFGHYRYYDPQKRDLVHPEGWAFLFNRLDELLYAGGIFGVWEFLLLFGSFCTLSGVIAQCRKIWQQVVLAFVGCYVTMILFLQSHWWSCHIDLLLE
jgi:hypothetical protein